MSSHPWDLGVKWWIGNDDRDPLEPTAVNDAPHCRTCTCGCTCGYGGQHDPGNPRCALNASVIQSGGDLE